MRRRTRISFIMLFFAFLPSICSGQTFKDASEARLSNGIKVILLENHKAPLVTFQVWYQAGSRNEHFGKTGLAHVLEHMMFKGTHKVSGEEFTRMVNENGGEENAFTSHDFAAFFETLISDRIGVSIALESDRMVNLVLREEDFKTERMVVVEERRMRVDDNPQTSLMEQLDSAAFQSQPYGWPVIGWIGDLERLTLKDVQDYYFKYYNSGNAFIVVVGDFRKEELVPELEKAFGSIPGRPPLERYSIKDPPQSGERRVKLERPSQLGQVAAAYHVPNLLERDAYVLEVIGAILSAGKSARLYDRLVRTGLALEAVSDYSLVTRDPSLFYVAASYLPDRDSAEVEKALYRELETLKTTPVDPGELEKAKNQLESKFVFNQDSLFSLGQSLSLYEIASDWRLIGDYIPSIRSVTLDDIRRVASLYFTSENRTVGTLVPTGPAEDAPPAGGAVKDKIIR